MNELEFHVLEKLVTGDDPVLQILRTQLAAAKIRDRELTGAGSFTYFDLPEDVERAHPASFQLRDVSVELAGLEHGVGAVLFISAGILDTLELYSWAGEEWPDNIAITGITYLGERRVAGSQFQLFPSELRNAEVLRRHIHGDPDGEA